MACLLDTDDDNLLRNAHTFGRIFGVLPTVLFLPKVHAIVPYSVPPNGRIGRTFRIATVGRRPEKRRPPNRRK
jgi:hypothetical protein